MQVLIQQQGFRYKSFRLREEDVLVVDRSFSRELEYAVDYLDLGVRTYVRTDTRHRLGEWSSIALAAIALFGGVIAWLVAGDLLPWGILLLAASLAWAVLHVTRAPRLLFLTGGTTELEFLAEAPDEAAVHGFVQVLSERVQETFQAKFLADADELPKEDRKARIEWLHEMKMISGSEKELLVAKLDNWSTDKRIGFQRRTA